MSSITPHQTDIKHQIVSAIEDRHKRIILQGSAGVGKTFLVNDLVKTIGLPTHKSLYLTAPTNKALAVLREKVHVTDNIEFCTVHSGLKLKRKVNNKTGEIYFKQEYSEKYPPFKNCGLLIIDEASMLGTEILGHLEQYDFPIIFIGDNKQLNPVKELVSPVFHQNWLTFELTEIIRQGEGNPIISLSRNIPSIWDKKSNLVEQDTKGFLYTTKRPKIITELAEVNGTDALKYLAWTNAEVDTINFSVRNTIYKNPRMIEKGETLIFNTPYGDFYTNQEIKITDLQENEEAIEVTKGDSLILKTYTVNNEIKVVHEESLTQFKNVSKALRTKCFKGDYGFGVYHKFIEQFADFKYNHAITVHKSQGSTYKSVILNVGNIDTNRKKEEKKRLFYTGITRASDLLILYNVK